MSITIGIGKNLKITPSGSSSNLDPDLVIYLQGLTNQLSDAQIVRLDTLFKSIKTGLVISRLSEAFDIFYLLAGETQESSLRNMVQRLYDATAINTPTFTQYEGFNGNAVNSYLRTNFNPQSHGVRYTLNNCSAGIYVRQVGYNGFDLGCQDAANDTLGTSTIFGAANSYCKLNGLASAGVPNVVEIGFSIAVRTAVNSFAHFLNNAPLGADIFPSSGLPDQVCAIGCYLNSAGVPSSLTERQYSAMFLGKSFNSAERLIIQNAVEAYMDANGKGIIT